MNDVVDLVDFEQGKGAGGLVGGDSNGCAVKDGFAVFEAIAQSNERSQRVLHNSNKHMEENMWSSLCWSVHTRCIGVFKRKIDASRAVQMAGGFVTKSGKVQELNVHKLKMAILRSWAVGIYLPVEIEISNFSLLFSFVFAN